MMVCENQQRYPVFVLCWFGSSVDFVEVDDAPFFLPLLTGRLPSGHTPCTYLFFVFGCLASNTSLPHRQIA